MLIGEFEAKITSGNRVVVPMKFRKLLGQNLILMNGYENCLVLVNGEGFNEITKDLVVGRFINNAVRDISRFLVGSAHEIEVDKQGRFVIPDALLNYGKLIDSVYFVGLMKWVEIWDKNLWLKRKEYIMQNADLISSELEKTLNNDNTNKT